MTGIRRVAFSAMLLAAPLFAAGAFAQRVVDPFDGGIYFHHGLPGETHLGLLLQYANAACAAGARPARVEIAWTGACRDGKLDGAGTLGITAAQPDAMTARITGSFVQGRLEGRAVAVIGYDGGQSYNGEFHDSLPNGHGVFTGPGGFRVEADYVFDKPAGVLAIDYPDGAHADLAFDADGHPTGAPRIRFADGTRVELLGPFGDDHTLVHFADGGKLEVETHIAPWNVWAVYCTPSGRRSVGRFTPASAEDASKAPYPPLAQRIHEEGRAEVSLFVGADGTASRIALHRSSGAERLDNAALATVARWRFHAAQVGDRAVAMPLIVGVTYDLRPPFVPNGMPEYFGPRSDAPPGNWRLRTCRG